jgi:hypothetical protein
METQKFYDKLRQCKKLVGRNQNRSWELAGDAQELKTAIELMAWMVQELEKRSHPVTMLLNDKKIQALVNPDISE